MNNNKFQPVFLKPQVVPKKWGRELVLINTEDFCSKLLQYDKMGAKSSAHFHKDKRELFRVTKGRFKFSFKNENGEACSCDIIVGDMVYLPACVPHGLTALEDNSEILEVSSHHSDDDVIRIEPGDSQKA